MSLVAINREKANIHLAKYNARWETTISPQLIENAKRLKDLIALEKRTIHAIKLLKDPTWIPRVPAPKVSKPRAPKTRSIKSLSAAKLDVFNETIVESS